jgi:hypothetical protein
MAQVNLRNLLRSDTPMHRAFNALADGAAARNEVNRDARGKSFAKGHKPSPRVVLGRRAPRDLSLRYSPKVPFAAQQDAPSTMAAGDNLAIVAVWARHLGVSRLVPRPSLAKR